MSSKRVVWAFVSLSSTAALAYGCSSSSQITNNPDSGSSHKDGGGTDAPSIDAPQSEGGSGVCDPDKPLADIPWAPPTPFHQGACTASQISQYLVDFGADMTPAFRANPANKTCDACIETSATAAKYGPVIRGAIIQTNFGGCVANIDGDTSSTGCGALINAYQECAYQECGKCIDWSTGGPMAVACLKKAIAAGGSCAPVWGTKTQQCNNDLGSGATAICGGLNTFLSVWCGPEGADGGSDGSTDGASSD
jgi:hypothetical protein